MGRKQLVHKGLAALSLIVLAYLVGSGIWRALARTPVQRVAGMETFYSYSLLLMESVALIFVPALAATLLPRAMLTVGRRRIFAFVGLSLLTGVVALAAGLSAAFALGEWGNHPVSDHVAIGVASVLFMPVLLSPVMLYLVRSSSPSRLVIAGIAGSSVVLKTGPIVIAVVLFAIDVARKGWYRERVLAI